MAKSKTPKRPDASEPPDDGGGRDREAVDDPHRLAGIYLRGSEVAHTKSGWALAFWRDQWWTWEGRRYRPLTDADICADVTKSTKCEFDRLGTVHSKHRKATEKPFVVAKVTRGLVSNVLQALKSLVLIPADTEQPSWIGEVWDRRRVIALDNGLLFVDALLANRREVLLPHSSKWFSQICLPYRWDPNASCPQFERFLQQIFEGDIQRIHLLQEWFGLCLVGDTSFQKFLILVGEGANGKTVVLGVLTKLLGDDNVSRVPLELFGQRFQLAPTVGKLANIVAEIGECGRVDEAILKSFVSGEPVHIDRKHLSASQAPATARLILATNDVPPFADRSNGLWRRLTILPFQVVIPPEQQDRLLTEKLLAELPGIFNWAIEGWRRLDARKTFTEPRISGEKLEEHRLRSNPVRCFLKDEMVFNPAASTPCRDAYRQHELWCGDRGFKPCDDRQFGKEVMRMFPRVRRERAKGGRQDDRPWMYVGLAFGKESRGPLPALPGITR